jgi:hypothetical protein
MKATAEPRHRRAAPDKTGGAAGNEKLTAMTGSLLLLLLAVEGLTILRIHELLTVHFFVGMLLVGPVLLKMCSTGYRFVRYYAGSAPYVKKGPPAIVLRLLGPVLMATSVGVIGTGVVLAFTGPGYSLWLLAHKAFFIIWFGAMTIHVLWYAPQVPRILRGDSPHLEGARTVLAGAGMRWLLIFTALAIGLLTAVATYHTAGNWLGPPKHGLVRFNTLHHQIGP